MVVARGVARWRIVVSGVELLSVVAPGGSWWWCAVVCGCVVSGVWWSSVMVGDVVWWFVMIGGVWWWFAVCGGDRC